MKQVEGKIEYKTKKENKNVKFNLKKARKKRTTKQRKQDK